MWLQKYLSSVGHSCCLLTSERAVPSPKQTMDLWTSRNFVADVVGKGEGEGEVTLSQDGKPTSECGRTDPRTTSNGRNSMLTARPGIV